MRFANVRIDRRLRIFLLALLAFGVVASGCSTSDDGAAGTDGGTPPGVDAVADVAEPGDVTVADVVPLVPPATFFHFGLQRGQAMSAAPFPNDLYLTAAGIEVEALADDPVLGEAAKPEQLARWSARIAETDGFGFTSAIRLFTTAPPELDSFEGRVRLVALTGPEAGASVGVQVFWDERTSSIGVFPAWGHWMMPASTYGLLVEAGVAMEGGAKIAAPDGFGDLLAADAPAGADADVTAAREAWAPLRTWLASEGEDPGGFVVGTVFTTQATLPFGEKLFVALDRYPLVPPTRAVRWTTAGAAPVEADPIEGAALDAYFGVPQAPFERTPGRWGSGLREDVALLEGVDAPYAGGTRHTHIGRVLNGSLRVPALHFSADGTGDVANSGLQWDAGGEITWTLEAVVPFTLYLCDSQLADPSDLPVAIFSHGGSGERMEAIAFANLNCQNGRAATIALDQPFHGTRVAFDLDAGAGLVVPTGADEYNVLTGLSAGDPGFVPDLQGDNGAATDTVGQLFPIAGALDPAIIEANLVSISAEAYIAIRYLREGDWSQVQAGLSFDGDQIYHQSLSFGSSFTALLTALSDDLRGVMSAVGSVCILSANLPMAPSNAQTVSNIVPLLTGSPTPGGELRAGGFRDFALGMIQWLSQRGDPLAWVPYVLRHRRDDVEMSILSFGDSWDETLYTPAQISYNNAFGFQTFTHEGPGEQIWTVDPDVPGAGTVKATAWAGDVSANVTFGGRSHTAVLLYNQASCHTEVITPVCVNTYEATPAPVAARADKLVFDSPVCAIHGQMDHFMASLAGAAAHGEVTAPSQTCESFYAD